MNQVYESLCDLRWKMISLERGQKLHAQACDGENLTPEDRAELESWYAQMDAEEAQEILLTNPQSPGEQELRENIRLSLERLQSIAAKTREVERGNEELRLQNEELKRQLASKGLLVA